MADRATTLRALAARRMAGEWGPLIDREIHAALCDCSTITYDFQAPRYSTNLDTHTGLGAEVIAVHRNDLINGEPRWFASATMAHPCAALRTHHNSVASDRPGAECAAILLALAAEEDARNAG